MISELKNSYKVVVKAKIAGESSDNEVYYHFGDINKTISIPMNNQLAIEQSHFLIFALAPFRRCIEHAELVGAQQTILS